MHTQDNLALMQHLQRQARLHTECIKGRLRVLDDLFMQLFFFAFSGTSKTTASGTTSLQNPIRTQKSSPGTIFFSLFFFLFLNTKCPLEGSSNVVASSQRCARCSGEPKVNQKYTRQECTAMAVSMVFFRTGVLAERFSHSSIMTFQG